MQRILSDHDVQGHVSRLMDICQLPPWVDLWRELGCVLCTFEEFELSIDATDAVIWQTCQDHDILLLTGNRNAEGPESLGMTIRHRNASDCLPVLTLADPDRIQRGRQNAESIVCRTVVRYPDRPGCIEGHGSALSALSCV